MEIKTEIQNRHWDMIGDLISMIGIGCVWSSPFIINKYIVMFINNINISLKSFGDLMLYTSYIILSLVIIVKHFKVNSVRFVMNRGASISSTILFFLPIIFLILCLFNITFWINYAHRITIVIWFVATLGLLPAILCEENKKHV